MTQTARSTEARDPCLPTGRRALAVLALIATAIVVVATLVFVAHTFVWLVVSIAGVAVGVAGLWWVLTERLPRRAIGMAGLGVGGFVVVAAFNQVFKGEQPVLPRIAVVAAALLVAALSARAAVAPDLRRIDRLLGVNRVRPKRPVLLCNPWSGDGKVERFGLKQLAEDLDVEVVVLDNGLDLAELARDAIARGADCLGMAGGDGSQALIAAIAHEHDIPFVCISAGTRNHFAQDLGLNKGDPRKGMSAFRDGVERFIDYGTVGKRLFVNNVSLGIYGSIVQQASYRDAKLETARRLLPDLLSHQAEPFDLQFTTSNGAEIEDAFVVQVSNNPYVWMPSLEFAQRSTMDSGKLGVFAINAGNGLQAAEIVTRALAGVGPRHDPFFHEFTAETFEVRSRSGKAPAGIDGEAVELETPLEFRIHPRGLRMLIPRDVVAASEWRRSRRYGPRGLVKVALGRQPSTPGARGVRD
jgi:diacylglycerol kinase family enzyme